MSGIKQQWQQLNDGFLQLSQREKWLITLAGCVAILFLLFSFVLEPQMMIHSNKQAQVVTTTKQINELKNEIAQLNQKLKQDPNAEIEKEYQSWLELSQLSALRLSEKMDSLVTPTAMAGLLEDVLKKTHRLHLVSLTSMPSEPIQIEGMSEDNMDYYIHPMRLVLTGTYNDIAQYLKEMEALPVKYYWRAFHYQVETYPKAKLTLEVYTLGVKKEFIGG